MNRGQCIVAGVMAGTSADGADVAVVSVQRGPGRWKWELREVRHRAYSTGLRLRILGATTAEEAATLDFELGRFFGRAVQGLGADVIACHGQTVFHQGRAATLQLGNPAVIAAAARLAVVSDFRSADIAAGGEGAPLVPWADWHLFGDLRKPRIALNLGGIANLTFLSSAGVTGFDTGPGNMLLDALAQQLSHGRNGYDRNGVIASRGRVVPSLLQGWLRHPYLLRKPPKSAGREQFGELPKGEASGPDLMATLVELTARTIADGVKQAGPGFAGCEMVAAGGGTKNQALMRALRRLLPGHVWRRPEEFGVPSQAREAMAFALLGAAHLWRVPANLPAVTGARRAVVLGSFTPTS